MKKHFTIVTVVIVFLVSFAMCTYSEEVSVNEFTVLEEKTYYDHVQAKIDAAEKSIFLLMPEIHFVSTDKDSKVTALMQALVRAQRRGVFVFVLLNLDRDRMRRPASLDAFFFLNDNGVDVHFDQLDETLAARFIVFDKQEVVIGSTLWNDAALDQGNQVDMMFSSEAYASRLVEGILNIEIYDNPLELEYYNQLYVYSSFIKHPNGMKAFVDRQDTDSFMMYLYLMKKYSEENEPEFITVNAEDMIKYMNIEKGRVNNNSHEKVRGLLERLQETYVLIKFEKITAAHDYNVYLYSLADSGKLGLPFCRDIRISANYFAAGWFYTLDIKDQYVYFYLLLLESRNGYGSWFDVSYNDFTLLTGVRDDEYVESIRNLRRENLIKAVYSGDETITDAKYNSFSCLIRRPYFKNWLDAEIDTLVDRYSGRKVKQAVSIAREFFQEKDTGKIEKIILILKKYSYIKVHKVVMDEIHSMIPEDPNKTIDYLEKVLKEKYPKL